jgi:hypothetical protein
MLLVFILVLTLFTPKRTKGEPKNLILGEASTILLGR